MARIRIYVQYYCWKCGGRVVPYSRFEDDTLAPNESILLKSFNSKVDAENRVAWCFSCDKFRPAERLVEADIFRKYRTRAVQLRRR